MNMFIKKILFNEKGEVSLSKVGTALVTVASAVLMIPTMQLDSIVVPQILLDIAKMITVIGGGTAAIGFRDAIGKNK